MPAAPDLAQTLEHVACPYCAADRPSVWGRENGYTAQRCGACGFVYVSPRPPEYTIDEAARTGLHEGERGTHDAVSVGGFSRRKERMFAERIQTLYPGGELRERPVRWLDVGCGFGELVSAVGALAHPGSEVRGIDPCVPKVEEAQARGLSVSAASLEAVGGGYDVVSLINVFSHLPDPLGFLEQLRGLLAPGGDLVIVTGNGADVEREGYPDALVLPDHLVFAGEEHVLGLLGRLGFGEVRVERYAHFYRDPLPVFAAKYAVKRLIGRPTVGWKNEGPFRSLFVRATLEPSDQG